MMLKEKKKKPKIKRKNVHISLNSTKSDEKMVFTDEKDFVEIARNRFAEGRSAFLANDCIMKFDDLRNK